MKHAIIAVRGSSGKSRCAEILRENERAQLAVCMLDDMLHALDTSTCIDMVWVVTPSDIIAMQARQKSVRVVKETSAIDLNFAFETAREKVCAYDREARCIFLPGDLPLLTADELDSLFSIEENVILVPAEADKGTNAVLMATAIPFRFYFGHDSLSAHIAEAWASGNAPIVLHKPSIGFDIDRPDDLMRVIRTGIHTRTAAFLQSCDLRNLCITKEIA